MDFGEWLLLAESIFDQHLFKGVMLLGGPGSGKSEIMRRGLKPAGFRFTTSDDLFELYLRKAKQTSANLSDPTQHTIPGFAEPVTQQGMFAAAKKKDVKRIMAYSESMIPYACEGTGANPVAIQRAVEAWNRMGYDAYGLYVKVPADMALRRMSQRGMRTDIQGADAMHASVQQNMASYRDMFQGRLYEIDNSGDLEAAIEEAYRIGKEILEAPLQNPVGRRRIEDEIGKFKDQAAARRLIPMAKNL